MLKMTGTVGPAVAPAYAGVAYMGFNIAQDSGSSTRGPWFPPARASRSPSAHHKNRCARS